RLSRSTLFPYTTLFRSETGFRVPESYFQDSQANIKASIFVEKLRDQVAQDGFSVPQGYFEELAARSIALAKVDQSMASTQLAVPDRKSTRLNSSHVKIS